MKAVTAPLIVSLLVAACSAKIEEGCKVISMKKVDLGDACTEDQQCKDSYTRNVMCFKGVCTKNAALGEPCVARSLELTGPTKEEVSSFNSKFMFPYCGTQDPLEYGEFSSMTETQLSCVDSTCRLPLQEGERCGFITIGNDDDDNISCDFDLFCSEDNVCTRMKAYGRSCKSSSECRGDSCSTRESDPLSSDLVCVGGLNGDFCLNNDGCISEKCENDVCVAKSDGASCVEHMQCGKDSFCYVLPTDDSGVCQAVREEGMGCGSFEEGYTGVCRAGLFCVPSDSNIHDYVCKKENTLKANEFLGFEFDLSFQQSRWTGPHPCKSGALYVESGLSYCAEKAYKGPCRSNVDCMSGFWSQCACDGAFDEYLDDPLPFEGYGTCSKFPYEDGLDNRAENIYDCLYESCNSNYKHLATLPRSLVTESSIFAVGSCARKMCSNELYELNSIINSGFKNSMQMISLLLSLGLSIFALFF